MGSLGPGQVVAGRFEVVRRSGAGGMSVVYEARDRVLGRTVALKVLDRSRANPERFLREAVALADLRHPAIVEYIAHGATPTGVCYLAMEWLEGEDLAERLDRGPLSIADTIAVARRLAEALAATHAAGIVHRDVKTGNVFLPGGAPDRAKLLDFGVARFVDRGADPALENARVGTPAYMSPEQARGERLVEPVSDVFSLGVVLYVCLTARRPFAADDALAVIARVLLAEPRPLAEARPDCPAALAALIARMMAKAPADRPADGAAVVAELDAALADAPDRPAIAADRVAAAEEPGPVAAGEEPGPVAAGEPGPVALVLAPALCRHARWAELARLAGERGARVEPLADGTAAIVLSGGDAPAGLAERAARCALALRRLAPAARLAVAAGCEPAGGAPPIGVAIDRAVALLRSRPARELDLAPAAPAPAAARARPAAPRQAPPPGRVAIDADTAGLLDPRFEVRAGAGGLELCGERDDAS